MTTYRSTTEQIQSPHAFTFQSIAVDDDGTCFAAERKGMRKTKKKGFVTRYPDPFRGEGDGEVLFETTEALEHLWRSDAGTLHATGKRYHTDAPGKWKSIKLGDGSISGVYGSHDDLWLVTYFDHQFGLMRGAGAEFAAVDWWDAQNITHVAVLEDGELLLAAEDGIYRFDGTALTRISDEVGEGMLCIAPDGKVYSTASDGTHILHLLEGDQLQSLATREDAGLGLGEGFSSVVWALGDLYMAVSHGEKRGLYRYRDGNVQHVMAATGYCDAVAGTDDVLWVSNGIELLAFDGDSWSSVERVLHQ